MNNYISNCHCGHFLVILTLFLLVFINTKKIAEEKTERDGRPRERRRKKKTRFNKFHLEKLKLQIMGSG